MNEDLLNIAKELSEKPTTELALQFMELTADNITKEKEINRLNNIINELEKSWKEQQEHYRYYKDNRYRTFLSKNLDKLKELKENK